jgi:TRAP-type C4-dicarboxylate transport system permease small subunit
MRAMPLGMEEAAVLVAGWTYFIAVALCTRDKKQITVNLFSLFHFPRRFIRIEDMLVDLASLIACGFFAYVAVVFAWDAHVAGFMLPPWDWDAIVQIICVGVGLSLCTLYLLIHLVQRIWKYDEYRRYEPSVWEQLGM